MFQTTGEKVTTLAPFILLREESRGYKPRDRVLLDF
jgi:hypothetical protein